MNANLPCRVMESGRKPSEVMSELLLAGPLSPASALELRVFLHLLAKHVYVARLNDGSPLRDAVDFKKWLEELSQEARL